MKHVLTILIVLLLAPLAALRAKTNAAPAVPYAVPPRLERIADATFDLGGRQHVFQQAIIQGWLLGVPERNPYMLGMFEEANKPRNGNLLPWSGEFAGKHLTGGVALYRLTRDPKLKRALDDFTKRLCGLQAPAGYLGPWPKEFELTSKMPGGGPTWDAWNHYHIMMGLLEYHRLTGDELSLETCRRIGDRLCAEFLDQPDKLIIAEKTGWYHGSMEFNLTPAHSLCLLHRATGGKKQLELARQIVGEGFARYGDYVKRALAGKEFHQTASPDGKRWERLHTLMALPELYWLSGEDDYRKAFEHIWWSIARSDIHNHGAFSTGEAATGNPYADGPVETCCTVAWQAMSVEMLRLTANPVVADLLELAQVNATYGSWDLSGHWSTYHTGMSGQRRPSTEEIAFQIRPGSEQLNCCSVNAPRGVGLLADWAVLRHDRGLALNWFGPGTINAEVGGVPVGLTQTTDYPRTGEVLIRVAPQRAVAFALDVRIPFWSQRTAVEVNGQAVAEVRPASYLRLQREWRPGDTIKLQLDMRPHYWPGERQYARRGSIYRGPVLLAWRAPAGQVKIKVQNGDWAPWAHLAHRSKSPGARLVAEFTGERLWLNYDQRFDGGRSRVSIDGREAVILDHYAPGGFTLCEWQSPPLSPGSHEVVIEVLQDAHPASKGQWVHLREFRLEPLPVLDFRTLTLSAPAEDAASVPWLRFTATDAQERRLDLVDFDSAGKNGGAYHTWLPLDGLGTAAFTRTNPLRSTRP